MTIPRVLLALALLVIGGMLWGLHKDIYGLKESLTTQGATVAQRIDAVNDNINQTVARLMAAVSRPPQVITKTEVQTRYKTRFKYLKSPAAKAHKPRRKYMRITQQPPFRWDQLLVITPETPPIYSTPLPP